MARPKKKVEVEKIEETLVPIEPQNEVLVPVEPKVEKRGRKSDVVKCVLNEDQQKLFDVLKTKSEKIRFYHEIGFNAQSIAKELNIRYQHVSNVITNMPKKKVDPFLNQLQLLDQQEQERIENMDFE